jgi:hypothetical protein
VRTKKLGYNFEFIEGEEFLSQNKKVRGDRKNIGMQGRKGLESERRKKGTIKRD